MEQGMMENVPGTNCNMTPYTSRTQGRQRFSLSTRPQEGNEDFDALGLENLVGQTWNIYAISALFGFKQDDISLKLYAKSLREEIANTLSREDVIYDAKFSVMKDIILGFAPENQPAIKIEINAKSINSEENNEKCIYKGILLFWGITQLAPNIQNSLRLPLLLCRGTRNGMDAVHTILNRMFDCLITTLRVKEDDLNWLIPIIIMTNKDEQRASGEIQMEYLVPDLPITDAIIVKFHISDLRKILTAIIKTQDDNIDSTVLNHKQIEMFYEILDTQMWTIGNLQLGLCTLHKISLSGISIVDNRMKIMDPEVMHNILLYLNEKAYDTFHALNVTL